MEDKKKNLIKLDYSNLIEVVEKTIEEKKKNKEWAERYLPIIL